ncbi:unnamed protein product [Symbiodinium sp. CCMP2592]|nr:unnamed protein product [Symbiodinium sp. CCMP2592]
MDSPSRKLALELHVQREAQRQSSKALLILEVKDAVIDSLEQRLNEALEEAAELKCRAHAAEDRVQAAELERRRAAEAVHAASTEKATELVAKAWDAEKRSEVLAEEARALRRQRSAAQAKAEATEVALAECRAESEAANSRAAASDETEIATLRETLHRCQADLVHAELEAEAAARRASAAQAPHSLSELTETPRGNRAPSRKGDGDGGDGGDGDGGHGPPGGLRLGRKDGDQADLEDILEAVKQHDLKMTAIKSELTRREEKGNATPDEVTVIELQTRRDEQEERLRILEATRHADRARWRSADESTLRDLSLLEEAASDFRTSLALQASVSEQETAVSAGGREHESKTLQEAVEDRAEVREELALARCLVAEASDSRRLLGELCGRRETLRAKQAMQQARLDFLTAAGNEASRAATKASLLAPLPPRRAPAVRPKLDMVAVDHRTAQLREEVALLKRQCSEKDDTRHVWQQEMLEIRGRHETVLCEKAEEDSTEGTRLPTVVAKSLRQLGEKTQPLRVAGKRPRPTSVKQARKPNDTVAKVLGSLLQLLAETQRRAVCSNVAAERYRKAALASGARGQPVRPFPRTAARQLEQALQCAARADDEASCVETHERSRLEAAAAEMFSELEETRGQGEQLEARRLAAVATLRAQEARAADEARARALDPSWRDEAVEEAWRLARETGRAPAADGEAEDVLRAAQVLRLLGLQLVAWELAENLKSAHLRADSLEVANAALARVVTQQAPSGRLGPVSPPRVIEAAWASKRVKLAEAEQRQREASRLQAEVQTFHAELARAQRSEAEAAAELAAARAAGTTRRSVQQQQKQVLAPEMQDPKLLASMLDVMHQVMEMCSGMLPAREQATAGSDDAMTAILKEVKELGGFCQKLQQDVHSQRQSLSAIALNSSVDGQSQRDETSKRMEALLELQHELQLQYKTAAEAVLGLRQDVAAKALCEEELQAEVLGEEKAVRAAEAMLNAESTAESTASLALVAEVEVTPEAAQLKELCRLERRKIEEAAVEADRRRRSFEEQKALADSAAAKAFEEVSRAEAERSAVRLAEEASDGAEAALVSARRQQRNRDEARAEELAATEWASHVDEEMRTKESLKNCEEKLKDEVLESERLRREILRVEGAQWELQKRFSPSLKRIDELRHRRATLETETQRVGAYPERAVQATQNRVVQVEGQVSDIFGQLEQVSAEEQQHKAEALVYASQAAAAAKLAAEAAEQEAAAELRLEAVQAQEKWQEIAHRDEHHAWRNQVQELQEQQHRSRRAQAAAEASQLEVEAALRRDTQRLKVAELNASLQDAESRCADAAQRNERHGGAGPGRQKEQVLLTELAAIRSQEATLLEEMEALRQAAALPGPEPIVATQKPARAVAPAGELQRLHAQLRRAREQKEVLKQEVAVGEREEQLLRKELEEVEQQLRLSRDDAERKRGYIATLQLHCGDATPNPEQLEAQVERQAELSQGIAKVRQSIASKDLQLKVLRSEAAEAKRRREAQRDAEAADARRCAADLARTKALRSELRRKEQALQELWAQSEVMESRLEESFAGDKT